MGERVPACDGPAVPASSRQRRRRAAQGGFTLLELVVALALLMLLSGIAAASLAPWLVFQQRLDTQSRLQLLASAWTRYLDVHAVQIESEPAHPGLQFEGEWLDDGLVLQDAGLRTRIAQALGQDADLAQEDGFHQAWVLRVSQDLTQTIDGVNLHFHVLALLSPGANGHLDAGTRFDPLTGQLLLGGDDLGARIDGLPAAQALLQQVEARVERMALAWQHWFTLRWQGDPERDVSIDYFAGPCPGDPAASAWDNGIGALPGGCGSAVDGALVAQGLGMLPSDIRDGNGGNLLFDSSSLQVRSPDQTDPARRVPPYSALIEAALPGGSVWRRSVAGVM